MIPEPMDLIDQAIFTSGETERASGYQVVATSPGVGEADARELAAWGPSHDSLLNSGPDAVSFNFHPLPSGRMCISRTTPAGFEYSGRGGARIYTQCLLVWPQTLARFANNPFALLRAALANGSLRVYDEIPRQLAPLRLAGRAKAVDTALLARLSASPGPEWIATLVQAALDSATVAVAGGPPAEHLIAGLINCLPPECRTEFSFSTGLKVCSRRPFRIVALSDDREEQRRVERLYNVAVLHLSGDPPDEFAPIEAWPRVIHRVLKSGRLSFLANQFARPHGDLSTEDLSALALQLLEEFDATAIGQGGSAGDETPSADDKAGENAPQDDESGDEAPPDDEMSGAAPTARLRLFGGFRDPNAQLRAHGAQHRPGAAVARAPVDPPSKRLAAKVSNPTAAPHEEARLSVAASDLVRLDELVFEAIVGRPEAVDELGDLWDELSRRLSGPLLAEIS
ncbi:MAG: hypothetical protein NUV77_13380 [Thermoguttaceae bacterium]|nr:hypothetical protein [Thermoguttaceae bacterium]